MRRLTPRRSRPGTWIARGSVVALVAAGFAYFNPLAGAQQDPASDRPPQTLQDCGGSGNAEVAESGGNYTTSNGGSVVYDGGDYLAAINAGIDSLTPGRNSQESVVVNASGSIGGSAIDRPNHTSLAVCGTIDVGNASGEGAIQSIGAEDVAIPELHMTGNPYFGLRFADVHGLHLGQIDLRLNGGLGIRFERDLPGSTDVTMDEVFVSGAGSHAVETWNIDGLTIGSVTARDVGESGLLIQNGTNAEIGTVDGDNVASGTGYAVFRTANTNGRVGDSYPTNIHVGEVIARGGGRGVFCVSQSGGVVIDHVDISGTGNNAILIENCYNVTFEGGTVNGGGEVRVAARDEFPNTSDVTVNLEVNNTSVRESPCGVNITWNITGNASMDVC